mmetsp:Transcript_24220/g.67165  ORF Transcript_24220/g.67165 Transcript_24220/m.67165 type:complete len:188 (+) Transcript_24220:126-689(+)
MAWTTTTPVSIRLATRGDAPALAELVRSSVTGLAPSCYPEPHVQAWMSVLPTMEQFRQRLQESQRTTWVACCCENGDEDDDTRFTANIVGFIEFVGNKAVEQEPSISGYIDCLYVAPTHARHVVATSLWRCLKAETESWCHAYVTDASEVARPFFERQRFDIVKRQERSIQGVLIWNHRMELNIESA